MSQAEPHDPDNPGLRADLDSHADTSLISESVCLITHDYERPVRLFAYDENASEAKRCKTVSGAMAYDCPRTGETYILMVHQSILSPNPMDHVLLCPQQMRDYDIRVNDEPKHMALTPTEDMHAIVIPRTGDEGPLRIPLSLYGVASYFPVRKPTLNEYRNTPLERCINLTDPDGEWDPTDDRFAKEEEKMTDPRGDLREPPTHWTRDRIVASLHSLPQQCQDESDLGKALEATVNISSITSVKTGPKVDGPTLAKRWGIGLPSAIKTVKVTTQRGVRSVVEASLTRRFRTNDRMLRYRRLAHDLYTDTLESSVPSWQRQNRYGQVYATDFGWSRSFGMKNKSDVHHTFSLLAQRVGVPPKIIMDGAKEQTQGEFRRKAREMDCRIHQLEPYSPWSNAAEREIKETKRGTTRKMHETQSPTKLWDHCMELQSLVRSHTALDIYQLDGQVPETILTGQTADISPFAELGWYDWVKFYDQNSSFPETKRVLGRWLGPAMDIGPAMCSKILKDNGQIIYISTFRGLTQDEIDSPIEQKQREEFDKKIADKLGKSISDSDLLDLDPDAVTPVFERYMDDQQPATSVKDVDEVTLEEADNYLSAQVRLPVGGVMRAGTVKKRARDAQGNLYGKSSPVTFLDTRVYEVEFPDGQTAEYAANVIAENMYAQCDPNGHKYYLMEEICGHRKNSSAVEHADRFVVLNGRQYPKKTTAGWELCVKWKDGSTSWERLADLKQSYPLGAAEYAVTEGIEHEPAFAWWVQPTLKKRKKIIATVNKRYERRHEKFGIEIPKSVAHAYELDRKNGNTLWRDAIAKEMKNVRVAFETLSDDEDVPVGHQFIEMHMIFDVKSEDFRRKARLVAGGHRTETPAVMTYASVVARDTVRIALTIAALNDLEVKASDVQNAYLTAPCEEKIWTRLGPEFGPDQGKRAVIVRALYGLKAAGTTFGRHISDCMRHLGYKPCRADPDLWMKPMVRPDDGFRYWAYILLYVDDCLAIHHDATSALEQLDKYFQMKPGSIGDPNFYLGAKLRKVTLDNGVEAWSISASKYVQEAVRNCETFIKKNLPGGMPKKAPGPWPTNYVSELDETPELSPALANFYQSLVGVVRWIVELGRVDVITEVSTLASHMALPREGHLDAALHLFAYLKGRHNARLVLDPTYPDIDMSNFQEHNWDNFYGKVTEAIPMEAPESRGKEVDLRLFVDSDHAGDKRNRRSRTGFFIFLNSALISWLSKKQPTVETSVFGAEFVALKNGIETLRGIRYKLRMMGVPISGPSYCYGDNMSVIHNTQRPESTLKKKSNQICYHFCREAVAMGECLVGHIRSEDNFGDLATKLIPHGQKRRHLVGGLLYDIFDDHGD